MKKFNAIKNIKIKLPDFTKKLHKKERKSSIKKKIFLSITLIILAAVFVIGCTASYLSYKSTFDTLEQTMKEVAKSSSAVVTRELDIYKTVASEVGLIPQLSNSDITRKEKADIFNSRKEMLNLIDLNIADKKGAVSSYGTEASEIVAHMDYFKKAMNGEVYVSGAQFDGKTFDMYFIIAAPLWKDGIYGSTIEGAVILKVDGRTISDIASQVVIGKKGFGSIIDRSGYTIGHPDYQKVLNLENTIMNYENDGSNEELAILEEKMLNKELNFGSYKSFDGKKLLSYSEIEGTDGWGLLVEVPQSEYMFGTYLNIVMTVLLGVAAILISAFIGFRISNKIADPIIACANRLKLLSEGDLSTEVPKKNSSDETGILLDSLEITINELNDVIRDITYHLDAIANADLTLYVEKDYQGDFDPIEQSLKQILKSLNYVFRKIDESTEQVAGGSQQVAAGAQVLTEGATEQASSIEELAATINEISEQIISNDENAQYGKKIAEDTSEEVLSGTEHMNQMIIAMNNINESSVQIGKIIKTIEDIAFQTNILALNAAVEAARAGSAGKGFAVVADEVRNLASKSAEAAKNTTQLIENSLKTIKKGTEIADDTLKSFNAIVEKTSKTVSVVEQIAEASKQQAIAASQINTGIEQISSVVQTNSATAEESAAASEELSGQVIILKNLLSKIDIKHSSKIKKEIKAEKLNTEENAEMA